MLLKMTLQTSAGVVDVETLDGQPFGEHSGIKVTTPEKSFTLPAEMRPLDANVLRIADALAIHNGFIKQQFVEDVSKKAIADFNALSDIERTIKRRNDTKAAITELYVLMKNDGDVVAHTRDHATALFGDEDQWAVTELVQKNSTVMPEKAAEHSQLLRLIDDVRTVVMPIIKLSPSPRVAHAQPVPNLSADDFGDIIQPAETSTPVAPEAMKDEARTRVADAPVVARVIESEPTTRVADAPKTAEVVEITSPALPKVLDAPTADVEVRVIPPSYVAPAAVPQRENLQLLADSHSPVAPRAPRRIADAFDAGIDILSIHTGFTPAQPAAPTDAPMRARGRVAGAPRTAKAQREELAIPELDDVQADLFSTVTPVAAEGGVVELDFVNEDFGAEFENPEFDPEDFRM